MKRLLVRVSASLVIVFFISLAIPQSIFAKLPKTCLADFNEDRVVDLEDRTILINDYFKSTRSNPYTDINLDQRVDLKDYSFYVRRYLKQCRKWRFFNRD